MAEYCMKCMEPVGSEKTCPHCGYEGEHKTAPHRLKPGTILQGRYLIGNMIGQGGFGITYMGRDLKLDMRVAVKEYYPNGYTNRNAEVSSELTISDKEQADFIENGKKKFLSEARALAQFHGDAGVVDVRDFFEANKTAYIVMEYLDGKDLRMVLKERTFSANEIFRLMRPVMDALEKIHAVGIIHRDISPDNIMLLKSGAVKLMDFGAARLLNYSDQKSVSVVLKSGYAPEEQYRPKGKLGPWTDIYALCATMYKCITGITPEDALERSHEDSMEWPSGMGLEITEIQEAVLKKGMTVEAEDRFRNIGEMKEMLDQVKVKIHAVDFETDDDDEKTMYMGRGGHEPNDSHEDKDEDKPQQEQDLNEDQEEHADSAETGKKVFPMAGIAVAAAVVIGGMAMFAAGKKANLDAVTQSESAAVVESSIAAESETESAEAGDFSFDEYIHIILGAGDEISVKGFNDAVQTLSERLEIFSGDMAYGLEVIGDKVDLYIPKSCLGDYDIYNMLRCYLTRATDLYAFNFMDAGYNPEKFALKREDLAEVTVMEGSIAGVDPGEYKIDSDTYPYLKVVLTDDCAEKHKGEIEAWGDQLRLAQDMSLDSYYYFNTFAEGDGKTFYVLNPDLEGPCFDLMYYNLTHEPLEKNFSFWIDLSYRANWDDVETAALVGENQCNVDEITGKTVTMYYTTTESGVSAGELLDVETAFKERLDSLEQPYAFGWDESKDTATIAVKTSLDHMGAPIIDSLGYRFGVKVRAGLAEDTLYVDSSGSEISYVKNADGTYQVSLQVGSSKESMISDLTGMLEGDGGGELILTVNGRPYLSAYVEEAVSGNTIVFDQVYLPEKGAITDENLWVAEFVEQVLCGTELPYAFNCFSDSYFMFSDDPQEMEELKFGISYDYLGDEIQEILNTELEEESTVYIDGTSVKVNYNLEVNETLPEAVLRLGKETYEKSEFADSPFQQLLICFIEENNETKERVRVIFDKSFNICAAEEKDRYIYVHGIFANGRLERYEEAFKNLVEADAFYQKMEDAYPWKSEYALWQYD